MKNQVLIILMSVLSSSLYAQTQIGQDIFGIAASDQSGAKVSISDDGERIAVDAIDTSSCLGYTRVYSKVASYWTKLGEDISRCDCSVIDLELETILNALRTDINGTMQLISDYAGWPLKVCDGYLFVSTNLQSTHLSGDHNSWGNSPMTVDSGFAWTVVNSSPGDKYKFRDGSTFIPDPWSRCYGYDALGEFSILAPFEAHLERFFQVTDGVVLPRTVRVWIPDGGLATHVLYMPDGQNIINPTAIWGGWKIDQALQAGNISSMMIVGVDHSGGNRFNEYTHVTDSVGGVVIGGGGDDYADFIQNTVRALIRKQYGEPVAVGLLGSTLGGLINYHIHDRYPSEFDFVGSMSGIMGWGSIGLSSGAQNPTMIEIYRAAGFRPGVLYLDSGGDGPCADTDMDGINDDGGGMDNYCENAQFFQELADSGYVINTNLFYHWDSAAPSNEAAWSMRVGRPLQIFSDLPGGLASPVATYFGSSMTMSADGSTIAIGESQHEYSKGAVRVYQFDPSIPGNWPLRGNPIPGSSFFDRFGNAVSLSADGMTLAVGAPAHHGSSGQVRIFNLVGATWIQAGEDLTGDSMGDEFGHSLSLSADGTRIAVGTPSYENDKGSTRIFEWQDSIWVQLGSEIPGESSGDKAGISVSLSADGNEVAIGASNRNNSEGQVRVFGWNTVSWQQIGGNIDGQSPGDLNGTSVSLSGDGMHVAIGSPGTNNQTGTVQVYELVGSNWSQQNGDLSGESAGDLLGTSVSLSFGGHFAAMGAPFNDQGTGLTRVFEFSTTVGIATVGKLSHQIYPNPVKDFATIVIQDPEVHQAEFRIFDLQGRQVYNRPILANKTSFSRDGLSNGLYHYQIMSGTGNSSAGMLIIH